MDNQPPAARSQLLVTLAERTNDGCIEELSLDQRDDDTLVCLNPGRDRSTNQLDVAHVVLAKQAQNADVTVLLEYDIPQLRAHDTALDSARRARWPRGGQGGRREVVSEHDISETDCPSLFQGTDFVDVPNVVGLSRGETEAETESANLAANVVLVRSNEPEGTVVAQNSVGGTLRQGSTVRLNVSQGPSQTTTHTNPTTTTAP